MDITEKTEAILSAAANNDVRLHKKFNNPYFAAHTMYDGPKELFERIVNGMWDICRYGVNNGFDGNGKNALDTLADIAVSLPDLGNGQIDKLSKQAARADTVLRTAKKTENGVSDAVRASIASCREAIATVRALREAGNGFESIDERQIELLAQSKPIFDEIEDALAGVMDVSSVRAKECAQQVMGHIAVWREDCSQFMCTSASLDELRAALASVKEWQKQNTAVTKRTRDKDGLVFTPDDLSLIVQSRGALERLGTFLQRIHSEKEKIENQRNALQDQKAGRDAVLAGLRAQMEQADRDMRQVKIDFQNGADKDECIRKLKELDRKKDDLLLAIDDAEHDTDEYAPVEEDIETREAIYKSIKEVSDMLEHNRDNLLFLAETVQMVDFNSLISLLDGRVGNVEAAIRNVQTIHAAMEVKLEEARKIRQILLQTRSAVKSVVHRPVLSREERLKELKKQREQSNKNDDKYLAMLMGDTPEEGEKAKEKEDERMMAILLGDDDK